jgi:Histidine kinase-, DNA gyrase B-, and HSP90-like ATPase/PAS fold
MQNEAARSVQPLSYSGPATWCLDLRSAELRSSAARAQMMGYDRGAVCPSPACWDAPLHPDERIAVHSARSRHIHGVGSGYKSEYRAQRRDGSWAWLEIGCIEPDRDALVVARAHYKYVAEIETDLAPLPPVRCHAGELNQVMLDLLSNASHAIPDVVAGSGNKGAITLSTRLDGDAVVISVGDTGGGIAEDIRHRIYQPFFTTQEVGRGTGQGLAISHNIIVKRHGGAIDCDSQVGKGTVFHLRLPRKGQRETSREQAA